VEEVRSLHTKATNRLPQLVARADAELDESASVQVSASKDRIEAAIRRRRSFCYPNGDSDARCEARSQKPATTTRSRRSGCERRCERRFGLKRCDMDARKHQDMFGRAS